MPDWAIHSIVPLLALLIVSKQENIKYVLLLLPLAIISDVDTFIAQHRAVLHNISVPVFLLFLGWIIKEKRTIFVIAAVYIASHVFMDMFSGGVMLFYPFYNKMAFVNASIQVNHADVLIWTLKYGFKEYGPGWRYAQGYISDNTGTGAVAFILLAGIYAAYMNWINQKR